MSDLELSTLDEIRAELHKRFDKYLLVTEKDRNETEVETACNWKGSVLTGIGMAEYAKMRIMTGYNPIAMGDDEE